MKLSGEYSYDVPRDQVWEALLDPEVLSRTLPGCEDLQRIGENEYAGKLKMKVGPVQGVFEGKVKLSDLDPPNGYHLRIDGRGAPGFMNGDGRLTLEDQGNSTLLRYEIEAQVGGRIASVGQRLLDSSAKVITKQGLEGLARQLETSSDQESGAGAGDGMGTATPEPTAAPSQAGFAGAFVTGLVDELVPKERQPLLAVAGLLAALAIIAVVMRACA